MAGSPKEKKNGAGVAELLIFKGEMSSAKYGKEYTPTRTHACMHDTIIASQHYRSSVAAARSQYQLPY